MYERRQLLNESFDDFEVKNKIIEISMDLLGFNTKINYENDGKDIDLLSVDDDLIGVEVERGGFVHDFWTDNYYELVSKMGYPTVNIPDRKEKHWLEYHDIFESGVKTYNPRYNKNIFVRTNFFFTQFIVIRPEIIVDKTKCVKTRVKVRNNIKEEGWLTFKKDYVETYNLIDGKLYLDTDPLGKIPILSNTEKKILQKEKKRIKELYKTKK